MADDGSLFVKFQAINFKPQGKNSLRAAIGHNKRTQPTSHTSDINTLLSHLNQSLFDLPATPSEVVELAELLMKQAQLNLKRKDTVIAVEVLFSLHSETSVPDLTLYFSDCAKWAVSRFKGQLLSADIHLDESSPHCHAIILLPLTNGGPVGSKLIGGLSELKNHTDDFKAMVGNKYGLRMESSKLTGEARHEAASLVVKRLKDNADPVLDSSVWSVIFKMIFAIPDSFVAELGITLPTRTTARETFKRIAMSSGAGPKTSAVEANRDRRLGKTLAAMLDQAWSGAGCNNQASIEVDQAHADNQPLSCVEVG